MINNIQNIEVKVFLLFIILTAQVSAQDIIGDWHGEIRYQGIELRLVFHVTSQDVKYKSTMDSPDQGATGFPMDETTFEDRELHIVAQTLGAEYRGKLSKAADTLKGIFKQNGISLDLIMTRHSVERVLIVRPQEPREYPYVHEDVKFENPIGGHFLAGTITIPKNGRFEKVVVLISGSGPQDRNEEVLNHRPFLVLSDHFTRQGIAVLRYDDRGVGESEGTFVGATTEDFADDATAAIDYLKSREDMEGKKIGLVGHSEGGMVAPMVASKNEDVDFIVLMAGPGIAIQELLLLQQEKIGEAEGVPSNIRQSINYLVKKMFEYIDKNINLTKDQLTKGVKELAGEGYDQLPDEAKQQISTKENFINQQIRLLTSDWYKYLMRFNPDRFLSKVKCPVLAVNGELDLQVTSNENLEGIRESLKSANNNKVTIHEFKGLNHLFQKTETGAPSEYGRLEETFNEQAMTYLSRWILELQL